MDYGEFPTTQHTGDLIKDWLVKRLKAKSITMASVCLITPDGDAAGLKAIKGIPGLYLAKQTCYLHGQQRAILYSMGMAGPADSNPDAKLHMAKHARVV